MEELAQWGTFLSGLGALVALIISIIQLNKNSKVNQANFWLTLRENFNSTDRKCVHQDLRDAKWRDVTPNDHKELIKIEDYMGLFEVCERMLERKIINEDMFISLYEYRVYNFKANAALAKSKLIFEYYDWKYFYKLLSRLYGNTWMELFDFLETRGFQYNEIKTESVFIERLNDKEKKTYLEFKSKLGID